MSIHAAKTTARPRDELRSGIGQLREQLAELINLADDAGEPEWRVSLQLVGYALNQADRIIERTAASEAERTA